MCQDVVCDLVHCGAMSSAIRYYTVVCDWIAHVGVKLDVECDNQVRERGVEVVCDLSMQPMSDV